MNLELWVEYENYRERSHPCWGLPNIYMLKRVSSVVLIDYHLIDMMWYWPMSLDTQVGNTCLCINQEEMEH